MDENQVIFQNNPLDNQLLQNVSYYRSAKILRNKFIIPIIILAILEAGIIIITNNVFYYYYSDDYDNVTYDVCNFFLFPPIALSSIIIILVSSFYLNNLDCRNLFLVLSFFVKGICVVFFMMWFLKYFLSNILIFIVDVIFSICSFRLQTELTTLKKDQNNALNIN